MRNTGSARRTVAVLVLGLGPSGRALLSRLTARGVDAVGIDPAPERPWTATYALWSYEVPAWLPPEVVAGTDTVRAFARTEHLLADPYVVLDPARLHVALTVDDRVVNGRVATADAHTVRLVDGRELTADVVVDARGSRLAPSKAQQTAVGVVLPRDATGSIDGSWFMDWRADNGAPAGATPSFLYVVPVGPDRVLVEETCLVGRPPLGYRELRSRLQARLEHRGVRLRGDEPEEHVRFAVEPEPPPTPAGRGAGPLRIGARGGIMHPATGYSVAPSLRLADDLAVLLASGVPGDAAEQLRSRRRRLVRLLRGAGLSTLLRLPPDGVPAFFETFFRLPPDRQRAYLTGHEDPAGVAAAMARMARTLHPRLTALAVGATAASLVRSAPGSTGPH